MRKICFSFFALAIAVMPFGSIMVTVPVAKAADNLLVNGGFEVPEVDAAQKWNIYPSGTANLGWNVEWAASYAGAPTTANLEIHENADATAPEGDQYAELDTDWDGPTGSLNGEQSSVVISQSAKTCEGAQYELSYQWKPRAANGPHSINVAWSGDGSSWSHSGTAQQYPGWQTATVTLVGSGGLDTVSFTETGTADSFGMYLDDVRLVQKTACIDRCFAPGQVADAFRYATSVVDHEQGLKKNGTAVNPGRSNPIQGLAYEAAQSESSFYSLGFDGWIIVAFTNPIYNGAGNDLKLTEDTWGAYPLEAADVYVSPDGVIWSFIGTADNTNAVSIHTVSEFDLATVGLEWAQYVKIVDVTNPAPLPAEADGYDLNAVEALYSGVECAPSVSIDKATTLTEPYEVMVGEEVTYTYGVTNGGNVPLTVDSVVDDQCTPVSYVSGDDGNGVLDVNETWNYSCTVALFDTTTNIGTVTAHDEEGTIVQASDSLTVAAKGPECTLTQGYWKNHSASSKHPDPDWNGMEDDAFHLSGQSYYGVLTTAPKGGNAYFILAHQFIASMLNGLTPEMYPTWAEAKALFMIYTPDQLATMKGKDGNAVRSQFLQYAGTLGDYNEGVTGPGHCSEL